MTKEEQVLKFNYLNDDINFDLYGFLFPTEFPISTIDTVPIYLMASTRDTLASFSDIRWLYNTLLPNYLDDDTSELIFKKIKGGHSTPLQAKDMSFFADSVMPFIARHI